MSDRYVPLISLSSSEREALEKIARSRKAQASQVQRARILLASAKTSIVSDVARQVGVTTATVKTWIRRFQRDLNDPVHDGRAEATAENAQTVRTIEPMETIEQRLSDEPRSGAPPQFTPEQLCQIMAIACEDPAQSERPITHWTAGELADEARKRQVVRSISPRHVGRFLKGERPQAAPKPLLAHSAARS